MIIGLDFHGGNSFFRSLTPPVRNIKYLECKSAVFDEIHARESIDIFYNNQKIIWQLDTRLLALFNGDLEAGNIQNSGLVIEKFAIKRRKINELDNITLGFLPFVNDSEVDYIDNTQANEEYIYSIVPISDQLEGLPNETIVKSDFTGWFILDKNNLNEIISCDMFIENEPSVDTVLNEDRILIETFNKYPQVYKLGKKQYHTFTLTALLIPNENENNNILYQKVINMINTNKPFIVKSSDGDLYIAEISEPSKSTLLNNYSGRQYMNINIKCTEIMSEQEYHQMFVGGE